MAVSFPWKALVPFCRLHSLVGNFFRGCREDYRARKRPGGVRGALDEAEPLCLPSGEGAGGAQSALARTSLAPGAPVPSLHSFTCVSDRTCCPALYPRSQILCGRENLLWSCSSELFILVTTLFQSTVPVFFFLPSLSLFLGCLYLVKHHLML